MLHKTDIGESITCRTALHEKHQSLIVPEAIEYEYLRYFPLSYIFGIKTERASSQPVLGESALQ
jgi:hypothetical protein